jgi:hypothetical protein
MKFNERYVNIVRRRCQHASNQTAETCKAASLTSNDYNQHINIIQITAVVLYHDKVLDVNSRVSRCDNC